MVKSRFYKKLDNEGLVSDLIEEANDDDDMAVEFDSFVGSSEKIKSFMNMLIDIFKEA